MLVDQRRTRLLEVVRRKGFASLPELAGELRVSESTVRRDLGFLEQKGEAQRTHGGVFYTGASPKLPHFDQRQTAQWEKKRQIAQLASQLIADGETVLLDGGSTAYEIARLLVKRPIQVVTNSLPVANLFTSSESADLVFIGGFVHAKTGVCVGPHANEMLSHLNVRRAVLSVAGINERGFYNSNLLLVETERAMMRCAEHVMFVADSTKFGHTSLALLCDWQDAHSLVVDSEVAPQWLDRAASAEVQVHIAPPITNGAASETENRVAETPE